MNSDFSLKRPALYNPALWSRNEVRTYYVARPKILARFLDDFRREQPGTRPQHRLILGQRGMGKSTLLRRLAIGVEDDAELAAQWLPLNFPEEQYNVATLADFWLNCLDSLGDWLEARGDIAEMQALDAEIERLDRKDGEGALQTLLRLAAKLQRRLLLLVDNIDLILERLKDKDWALREALQEHPELLLVGASSRALEATYDYSAAFYDFFRIDELRGLSEEEMRETIINLARLRGADELIRRLDDDPGRLRVLHTLTGGNPRTAVLLYGVLLKGIDGDVRSDLEGLLDEVTPLYKARFDELPAQAQQLLDKLALHWDPMSARQAADALGWPVNQASAQLDRLVQAGVVEKVKSGRGKRMAFQVAERFFNIWYLMRASRRVRRKLMWLVEFLRAFFSNEELHRHARQQLDSQCAEPAVAEYMLALGRAMGNVPMARALEMKALGALLIRGHAHLEEMFDLRGEDADLANRAELIQLRQAMRTRIRELLNGVKGADDLYHGLIGLPLPAGELVKLVEESQGEDDGLSKLREFVRRFEARLSAWLGETAFKALHKAISLGDMVELDDVESGEAAALHLGEPVLAVLTRLYFEMRHRGTSRDVEKAAQACIDADQNIAVAWYALGGVLLSSGRKREAAIAMLRKAIELAPEQVEPKSLLGWELLGGGPEGNEEASKLFSRALELEPKNADAKRGLVLTSIDQGRSLLDQINPLRELCELEPNDSLNQYLLASALAYRDGCEEEQLNAARKAVNLDSASHFPRWLLAKSLLFNSLPDEAMSEARAWFDLLAKREVVEPVVFEEVPNFVRMAIKCGVGKQVLDALDESGFGEKVLPIREALAAVVEGSIDVLRDVAPEIREPSLEILKYIAPGFAEGAERSGI
jgi:tetratricopeptide (TPR) repeat protein